MKKGGKRIIQRFKFFLVWLELSDHARLVSCLQRRRTSRQADFLSGLVPVLCGCYNLQDFIRTPIIQSFYLTLRYINNNPHGMPNSMDRYLLSDALRLQKVTARTIESMIDEAIQRMQIVTSDSYNDIFVFSIYWAFIVILAEVNGSIEYEKFIA